MDHHDNPYSSPSQVAPFEHSRPKRPVSIPLVILLATAVAANYASMSRIILDYAFVFSHVVFLASPLAIPFHVESIAAAVARKPRRTGFYWPIAIAVWLSLGFFVAWIPLLFDLQPFEQFISSLYLFGPYAWHYWAWFILCAMGPLLSLLPALARNRWVSVILSSWAIAAHLHNASLVWMASHGPR